MTRVSLLRALAAPAVLAGALALAGCDTDGAVYQLPTRAMKELSPQMLALLDQKHMAKDSPILVRIFKEESELEVWKVDTTGRYELLKVYPICRWSGDLGPKVKEGDRQAPEGFYQITPDLMNPNSNYYLAINTGFPNAYDRANNRHGAFLMIHGDCSSRGCYAMTDEQIGEIYSLGREAFLGGQQSFQIQAYPFRMTAANMARHRNNPNMAFWRMIKEGNDHFEATHLEPKIEVCDRHYVFDPKAPVSANKPINFTPTGHCPSYVVSPEIAGPVAEKERADELQYVELVKANTPTAPIRSGLDGGMNRVFLAQVGGNIPPARVPAPLLPPQPEPVTASTAGGSGSGNLFNPAGAKPAEQTQVATTEPASQERGGGFFGKLFNSGGDQAADAAPPPAPAVAVVPPPAKPRHSETASLVQRTHPKAESAKSESEKNETGKTEAARGESAKEKAKAQADAAKAKPVVQQEANATNPPATAAMTGAQPTVPSGNFSSRWGGL